jgi:DNA-binding MarR family transcriptional regulator
MSAFDAISTPTESRIGTGFARIGTAMRSHAWELAVAHGLTPTQVEILALLGARSGPLRLSTIAEQLAITPATASDAVSTLVGKGLVDKEKALDDRRAVALGLSKAGVALAHTLSEGSGFLDKALSVLNPQEQAHLLHMMVKVIRTMQEHAQIPSSRMCVTCKYFDANRYPGADLPHHCKLVGSAFGDTHLRLDCPEHEDAEPVQAQRNWHAFAAG